MFCWDERAISQAVFWQISPLWKVNKRHTTSINFWRGRQYLEIKCVPKAFPKERHLCVIKKRFQSKIFCEIRVTELNRRYATSSWKRGLLCSFCGMLFLQVNPTWKKKIAIPAWGKPGLIFVRRRSNHCRGAPKENGERWAYYFHVSEYVPECVLGDLSRAHSDSALNFRLLSKYFKDILGVPDGRKVLSV